MVRFCLGCGRQIEDGENFCSRCGKAIPPPKPVDVGPQKQKMVSLKTICKLYDWKYDTIYKKYKNGEFVQGYRDPAGRSVRFDLEAVERWAHRDPIKITRPSLIADDL